MRFKIEHNNRRTAATAVTNFILVFCVLITSACRYGSSNEVNKVRSPDGSEAAVAIINEVSRNRNGAATLTTVILVRHAEKAAVPQDDPPLNGQGIERANLLKNLLFDKNVAAIYTSSYRRARETAKPLADELGIVPVEINEAEPLARSILSSNSGQRVLVVAHTNTIPEIIKNLCGREIDPIYEEDFSNLFIVVLSPDKPAEVVATRY